MSIREQLEKLHIRYPVLAPGGRARIRQTGQVVDLKRVSAHGFSVITFRTGGDYLIPSRNLKPLYTDY